MWGYSIEIGEKFSENHSKWLDSFEASEVAMRAEMY
jgi:hypothetical protein